MATPTWKLKPGVTVQMTPDSPTWTFANGKHTLTLEYEGKYTVLLSSKPAHGQSISGYPSGLRVVDVTVKRVKGGGKGQMTVRCEKESAAGDTPGETDFETPIIELEWAQIEKPIEQHPKFRYIHQAHKEQVGAYFSESDATARASIYDALETIAGGTEPGPLADPEDEDEVYRSAAVALRLIQKKSRGVESYLEYHPIVRRTYNRSQPPTDGAVGEVLSDSELASEVGVDVPEGYEYMKTAARGTKSGTQNRWQLVEEWTGAEDIDGDLYPIVDWTEPAP